MHHKLFIGSLGIRTTSETLRQIFSAYGEIKDALVVRDKFGVSKEYGFVIFKNVRSMLMALKEPYKTIDGKMTITKVARSRIRDVEDESLQKGPFGFDKETGKSRGYVIFVYRTLEGAKTAIYESNKCVDGHNLTCEMAIPKTMMKNPRVGPNLDFDFGPGQHDHYNNAKSRFNGCSSRSEVSQVGTQYAPYQGNGQMYAHKCDCRLGLNHMGSGLYSNMDQADYSIWASEFPRHRPLWFGGSSL
ncbi:UBP1-associated protein 2C-like [Solanum stenotomum]|uniref:UBP1-associated protein 2C-like n=1 Tax=Solanum stenotomum TaxID=172797 RepID=UPI0020D12E81|nr:UBP1-associated protein 2C-like [Solanum stenotomum]